MGFRTIQTSFFVADQSALKLMIQRREKLFFKGMQKMFMVLEGYTQGFDTSKPQSNGSELLQTLFMASVIA